mmetsp:Transcript_33658/g.77702  ORF Transcript_33658/g.77702 Transcript_33658/m.77702 type:complete len:219 (+) Transcript_33658:1778-2434(+)
MQRAGSDLKRLTRRIHSLTECGFCRSSTDESNSGRRSVSRSSRASRMSRSAPASASSTAAALSSASPSAAASSSANESIALVIIDSSYCAYASKTSEKSRTVITEVIASSYTSRACSNCACRMNRSASETQMYPTSLSNSRRPPRMMASARSLPATCSGFSDSSRHSRSHVLWRVCPRRETKFSRLSSSARRCAASPTRPTESRNSMYSSAPSGSYFR